MRQKFLFNKNFHDNLIMEVLNIYMKLNIKYLLFDDLLII